MKNLFTISEKYSKRNEVFLNDILMDINMRSEIKAEDIKEKEDIEQK